MSFQYSGLQFHKAIGTTEKELKYCKNHLIAAQTTYFFIYLGCTVQDNENGGSR